MNNLSVVFGYIRSYYRSGYQAAYMGTIICLMAVLLAINYYIAPFRSISAGSSWIVKVSASYLLYLIPFSIAYLLQYVFSKRISYLRNRWLSTLILLAPLLFALRVNLTAHRHLIQKILDDNELIFWLHCGDWLVKALFILSAVYAVGQFDGTRIQYAARNTGSYRPYLLMILCMVPFICIAAFQPAFHDMYPRSQIIPPLHLPYQLLHYIIFEILYAFDFISIEVFFRGFLIFAFMRICGMNCIVPAACFYCCIHFGKPMGEAIGSFFGGLLLGVISFHTRSIRGGVIVHLGVAAAMEIAGAVAHAW